jgi:hypothetical protein
MEYFFYSDKAARHFLIRHDVPCGASLVQLDTGMWKLLINLD